MEGKHTPARKGGRRRLEKHSEAEYLLGSLQRNNKATREGSAKSESPSALAPEGKPHRSGVPVFSSLTVRQKAHLALARMGVRWDRQAQCYSVSLSLSNGSEVTNTLKGEGRADITRKEVLLYTQMRGFLGKASIFEFVLFQTTVNLRDCV